MTTACFLLSRKSTNKGLLAVNVSQYLFLWSEHGRKNIINKSLNMSKSDKERKIIIKRYCNLKERIPYFSHDSVRHIIITCFLFLTKYIVLKFYNGK